MRSLATLLLPVLAPLVSAAGSDPQSISSFAGYSGLGCATNCFYQYRTVEYFGTILGCQPTAEPGKLAQNDCYCNPVTPTKVASWLSRCNQQFCGGADPTPAISVYGAYCSANGFPNAGANAIAGGGSGGSSGGGSGPITDAGSSGPAATGGASGGGSTQSAAAPGAGGIAAEGTVLLAAGLGLVSPLSLHFPPCIGRFR